jgi:hypothetical protein
MKSAIIFAVTHFSILCNGIEIPNKIINAIATIEGGKTGSATKEKNGRYSYGKYQISAAFLTDVNKHYGTTFNIKVVRDHDNIGEYVCQIGLAMIMQKRKCNLETAIASYNGGWSNRNKKACKDYAARVMALEAAQKRGGK